MRFWRGWPARQPVRADIRFQGVEHILKSQVAQVAQDRWQIRIVPAPAFSKVQELALVENIRQLVDKDIMVEIVLTSDIPNTSSVKFRWVVNEHEKINENAYNKIPGVNSN